MVEVASVVGSEVVEASVVIGTGVVVGSSVVKVVSVRVLDSCVVASVVDGA